MSPVIDMSRHVNNLRADVLVKPSRETVGTSAEADTAAKFIILRKETNGFSTRGPIARALPFSEASAEILRLKAQYPRQDFVLVAEIAEAVRTESIAVVSTRPAETPATPYPTFPVSRRQSGP